MITNFQEYEAAYFSKENQYYKYDFIDKLSHEEVKMLKHEIENWSSEQLAEGHRVLSDYYGMKISDNFLKQICIDNFNMAFEIYTKGVSDTCQRSVLVGAVLYEMGMGSWPTYGDGDEAYKKFMTQLKETGPQFGVEVTSHEPE